MGIVDTRVISIFVTAFGGGALATWLGVVVVFNSLPGLIAGVLLGAVVFFFGQLLYRQQALSSVSAHHLIGRVAKVIVTILPNNVGKISCKPGEEQIEKPAHSRTNTEIRHGTLVVIEAVAEPLGKIDKVVMIDNGGGNGSGAGPINRFAQTGLAMIFSLLQQLQAMGLNVPEIMSQPGIASSNQAAPSAENKQSGSGTTTTGSQTE